MKILAIIPARYASTRFPAKPLANIAGKPMIQRVYESTVHSQVISKVVVATDHPLIYDTVKKFGGNVEMTREEHATGTDRIAEVASRHTDFDVIVNIQGDQPFVTHEAITKLVEPYLRDELPDMTTIGAPLNFDVGYKDENTVKVICNLKGRAMYFSRAPIPFFRHQSSQPLVYQHIGLYGFRRDFLFYFAMLPPSPLEQAESLEQLRALENGHAIHVGIINQSILEVNTPEDLEKIDVLLKSGILSF